MKSLALAWVLTTALFATAHAAAPKKGPVVTPTSPDHIAHSDAEWKKLLTPEQYRVLREKGTEIAFTGKYWNEHRKGTYLCAACGYLLFDSSTKFESGTGWPSFYAPADPKHVRKVSDTSLGIERDEIECARCGSHLGHVFDDGPAPTGLRYCMNSVSRKFVPATTAATAK